MNWHSCLKRIRNKTAEFLSPASRLWLALNGVDSGKHCRLFGLPIIHKADQSLITIGTHFTARSSTSSNSIGTIQPVILTTTKHEAEIRIGNDVGMSGCSLCSQSLIQIGDRVSIGSGTLILDNDSQSLDPSERAAEVPNIRSQAILIEDDVFIGARSILLKGTQIGSRTIIQAGSVVSEIFPSDCIIGGNPAVILSRK